MGITMKQLFESLRNAIFEPHTKRFSISILEHCRCIAANDDYSLSVTPNLAGRVNERLTKQ